MTTRVQRSAAVVAAFGIALSTAAIGAPAFAVEAVTPALPDSNVDSNLPTKLTIHKYLNPTSVGTPTGNTGDSTSGDLVEGVEFTVREILDADGNSIDMTDNGIFQIASQLKASDFAGDALPTGYTLGSAVSDKTDANGIAFFGPLGQGVFLVEETSTAGAKVGGTDVSGTVTPSAPFIAFLPMTKVTTGGSIEWNYDVHAYPKNSSQTATKTVKDQWDNVGDTLEYTITTDIPNEISAGQTLTSYVITDPLDDRLNVTPADVSMMVGATSLTQGENGDYKVIISDARELTIEFTVAGLAKLRTNQDEEVVTTINAVVNSAGGPEGTTFDPISNQATVSTNLTADFDTNEVDTFIGKLKVNKTSAVENAPLSGAEFQLYRCDDGVLGDGPLTVRYGDQSKDTWETDSDGTFTIDGLHASDFADGAALDAAAFQYCLVETKALAGHELLPEPFVVDFTLEAVQAVEAVADGDDAQTKVVQIENVASVSSQLPSTGGMGVGLLIAAGVGLVGAGAYAAKRNNDKSGAAEA